MTWSSPDKSVQRMQEAASRRFSSQHLRRICPRTQAALQEAISINPSAKRQVERNVNFAALRADPAFIRLVAP